MKVSRISIPPIQSFVRGSANELRKTSYRFFFHVMVLGYEAENLRQEQAGIITLYRYCAGRGCPIQL